VIEPRLLALATAVPPHVLDQDAVATRARHLFAQSLPADLERLMPVFANAGIERRYSCVPISWYDTPHGWTDRNPLYLEHATLLLERVARDAMARAGLRPAEIDAIVVVSTTGIATPSLDAVLINRLGLRSDVTRLPIFGLGCAGGVLGLARAADLARAHPGSRVLFLVVELCALSFRKNDTSKSNLVATALFGDGAAGAVLSTRGAGKTVRASVEHTWPETLDIMGWEVAEDGLKALMSRDIPSLVRRAMRDVVNSFLGRQELRLGDITRFVCHPGGAKVLSALEHVFDLAEGALAESRAVLRDFGNMSAATVLFVLDRVLRAGTEGRILMSAMGPGFTAALLVLE